MQTGLIPATADNFNQCSSGAFINSHDCDNFFDQSGFDKMVTAQCEGQKSCSISGLNNFVKG